MNPVARSLLLIAIRHAKRNNVSIGEVEFPWETVMYRGIPDLRNYIVVSGDFTLYFLQCVDDIEDILDMEKL